MSKSTLTPEQLGQPARLAARTLARFYLLKVLEEAARLEIRPGEPKAGAAPGTGPEADEDPEAVHDFRVALRRLRSWLQAFRPFLDDTVTRRSEGRLRRLSAVAGEARDLQVQRASLREMGLAGNSAAAADALRIEPRIAKDEARARRKLTRKLIDDLPKSSASLAAQLQEGELNTGATMAVALAQLLMERLEEMETSLGRLKRVGQIERAHEARITVKRLRYLLEAFGRTSRLAVTAVLRLTEVQDAFGRLHDAQVLAHYVADRRERPALRSRLRRNIQVNFRHAIRVSRSRDIVTAQDATARLIRRLELRS
jgi:CHAD domain-containing protein